MRNASQNTKNNRNKANAPTHIVFHVVDSNYDKNKGYWTRVGAAWEHQDGEGFNIQLNLFPVDGRLVIRTRQENDDS